MTEPLVEHTSPLQIADYRRYWLARFFATFATLAIVVLLAYQTYDIARDQYSMGVRDASLMLGLLGAAQFVPLFLLTPVAGVAADRFDRRRVVLFANAIDGAIALTLALTTLAGTLTLPLLFVLAAAHGAARVFNGPALSAIAPNIVPPALLPKAIALSSMGWQVGTVAGPAVGGFLFAASPSGIGTQVGAWIVSRILGKFISGKSPRMRPNTVWTAPSICTGTTEQPVRAATKAGPS